MINGNQDTAISALISRDIGERDTPVAEVRARRALRAIFRTVACESLYARHAPTLLSRRPREFCARSGKIAARVRNLQNPPLAEWCTIARLKWTHSDMRRKLQARILDLLRPTPLFLHLRTVPLSRERILQFARFFPRELITRSRERERARRVRADRTSERHMCVSRERMTDA